MGDVPEVSYEEIERGDRADDGDETVEERKGKVANLSDMTAEDGVGHAHGRECDQDGEGEDKHGKAGAEAEDVHAEGSQRARASMARWPVRLTSAPQMEASVWRLVWGARRIVAAAGSRGRVPR